MTKTNFDPKISSIADSPSPSGPSPKKEESRKTGDSFRKGSGDPFKAIISGRRSRTDDSLIGSMLDEIDRKAEGICRDPYDSLMGALMWGDDAPCAKVSDFEQVEVPSADDIYLKNPGIQQDINGTKAILERFIDKEKEIEALIASIDAMLDPKRSMQSMRADEIQALTGYREYLSERLGYCRSQIDRARFYYDWAKKDADAAKEKLKEEIEWWNKEE